MPPLGLVADKGSNLPINGRSSEDRSLRRLRRMSYR
jgi:hypothetical protein